jgi:pyrroline-5-carboxylate reductase
MTSAIISGLLESKSCVKSESIVCNDVVIEKVVALQRKYGAFIAEDKGEAIIESDIIFLYIKPQNISKIFDEQNFDIITALYGSGF